MRKVRPKAYGALALLLLASCGKADIGVVDYALDQCRRVTLTDLDRNMPLVGIEDIAADWAGDRLFLAAYDRRATEKAAKKRKETLPQGGVYAVSISALFDPATESLDVKSLAAPGDIAGGLHPHGLSFDAAHQELIFINRTYERAGKKWVMTPKLQRLGANGEMFIGATASAHCAANNIVQAKGEIYTSFDHANCNWRSGLEDLFRQKKSGLANKSGKHLYEKAAYANGLAITGDGEIVMAATREKALLYLSASHEGVKTSDRVDLPGGPDNLTIAEDGSVIAAVHPSMLKLALNRKMGIGKAPSRIVRIDPEKRIVNIIFDDPKGKTFSAATVGLETEQGLVAGSVTDEGLLVCRKPS